MWNPIAAIVAWDKRISAMDHIERENYFDDWQAWGVVIIVVFAVIAAVAVLSNA